MAIKVENLMHNQVACNFDCTTARDRPTTLL